MVRTAGNGDRADEEEFRRLDEGRGEREVDEVPVPADGRFECRDSILEVDGPCCEAKKVSTEFYDTTVSGRTVVNDVRDRVRQFFVQLVAQPKPVRRRVREDNLDPTAL